MNILEAIKEYQCPGCTDACDPVAKEPDGLGAGCKKHCPGTMSQTGTFFLGMPKGFCRLGANSRMPLQLFESYDQMTQYYRGYDKYNVPCWKYLDEHGNTLIRWLSPRINVPFLHVILGDCRDHINCREVLKEDLDKMD